MRWKRWAQRLVAAAGACVAAALLLGVWALWIEPRSLVIREHTVPLDGLTEPVRVLLVGDLQPAGPHETPRRLARIMARLQATDPDLVVWVGDFVSERRLKTSFTRPEDTAAAIGTLQAPLGQLAVLGNHDWWFDGPAMERLLEAEGVRVLRDERVRLPGGLVVAGVEDPVTRRPNLARALRGVGPSEPVVLLSHTPDLFPDVPAHVDLTLAGHTHCGQVTIPGLGRPVVPSDHGERFAYGWHGRDGHAMLVTCGIGTAIVPVRLGNPPEAVVLSLVPADRPVATR